MDETKCDFRLGVISHHDCVPYHVVGGLDNATKAK
jgi:hypothetical protein